MGYWNHEGKFNAESESVGSDATGYAADAGHELLAEMRKWHADDEHPAIQEATTATEHLDAAWTAHHFKRDNVTASMHLNQAIEAGNRSVLFSELPHHKRKVLGHLADIRQHAAKYHAAFTMG